jgi:hypothetical protein
MAGQRRRARLAGLAAIAALAVLGEPTGSQPASTPDCLTIDDFARARVGEPPPDWRLRKDSGHGVYAVREEGGRRVLHAHAREVGVQLGKPFEWDLAAYPVLRWSWRPIEFPRGADERDPKRNDSALAVYLIVPHSQIKGPKAVKYVWSERVPAGTRLASNGDLTQVFVLRTGAKADGGWVEERVNARDHFLQAFEAKEVPRPAGIAVLTDADDTGSSAQGQYAAFRACRS